MDDLDRYPLPDTRGASMRSVVDLPRLPILVQYAIGLVTAAIVVGVAWSVGKTQPVPEWITSFLIPALGWGYIVLLLLAASSWLIRRTRSRR